MENLTSNIPYKKAKYHENLEVQLLYQKCRYQENPESKIIYQKARYQENCEKQIEYQNRRYKKNPVLQIKYNKMRYQENKRISNTKGLSKKRYQEKTKGCGRVQNFLQQVKQGPYYICTICHRSLYRRSDRFFKYEKYYILCTELHHPVK